MYRFKNLKKRFKNMRLGKDSLAFFIMYLVILTVALNIKITGENEFSVLSEQFALGHTYLPSVVGDAILHDGKYYWHLGPFPALLLAPFSLITLGLFNQPMPQGVINIASIAVILCLAYRISLKFGFNDMSSKWAALAITYSSVFFLSALLPWSWHFSQTLTFLLGLLALNEYFGKKRPFLIGLYHSLMFMTRFTAGFGVIFYILAFLLERSTYKEKFKKCLLIIIPVFISGVILLYYNYIRFQNPLDNGYTTSNNWVESPDTLNYEMLKYGLFNIKNIPTNLYYYFINMPAPVMEQVPGFHREMFQTDTTTIFHLVPPYIQAKPPGVSFFVVSPIFLLMFRNRLKAKESKLAAITACFILVFLLTYYWTGWTQIGPRYMIDLLPFLFILFLESYKVREISSKQRFIIACSALFNVYLLCSVFV